jgi:hypothetical protein
VLIKAFIIISFSFYFLSCSGAAIYKQVNPVYKEKIFNDRVLAIVIQDSLINSADKNTIDFIDNNIGNFESFFKDNLLKYLSKYSTIKDIGIIRLKKSYLKDKQFFKNRKTWEFVNSPVKGTIIKDDGNTTPGLVLILYQTTLRSFYNFSNSNGVSQGYISQNSARDGHINIEGRMLLWDNVKGDVITYGVFKANKYLSPLTEMTKNDFEDCLKLLVVDITSETPIYNKDKASELKKLQ